MPDPEEIRRLHQQEQSAESGRELGLYTAAVFKGLLEGGLSESAPSNWSPPTSRRWSCADRTRRARADPEYRAWWVTSGIAPAMCRVPTWQEAAR